RGLPLKIYELKLIILSEKTIAKSLLISQHILKGTSTLWVQELASGWLSQRARGTVRRCASFTLTVGSMFFIY
ncbi:MAG: hypothetical protein CO070_07210, partial [Gallionellales bacterium CG_4_9_14_0_8_um_filter_55_61]